MEDVREKHKLMKSLIKHHFKKIGFKMTDSSSQEQFRDKLQDMPEYHQLPEHIKNYFFNYFLMKIKSKK